MLGGTIHEQRGDIPKASELYEKVPALNPRFAPAANNLAWILSEHGGDKDKALTLAQTAKELAPEDPRVSDTLGWIFYRRGVHQRALALLKDSAAPPARIRQGDHDRRESACPQHTNTAWTCVRHGP